MPPISLRKLVRLSFALDIQPFVYLSFVCIYIFFLNPWGNDLWFHIHRLDDIKGQLEGGRLVAYFSENVAGGRGLPVYAFYSQWVYWLPFLLTQLGVSLATSLKLVFCFFMLSSAFGFYRLLQLHVADEIAKVGLLLYVTSNYFLGDIFARAAFAEFLSYSLFPWVLYSIHRYSINGNSVRGLYATLAATLMIIFHPLSFMNVGLAMIVYALYILWHHPQPIIRLGKLAPVFVLTLALTAFFWLPAVIERQYVMGAEAMPVDISDTFLGIRRYLNVTAMANLGLTLTWTLILSLILHFFSRKIRATKVDPSAALLIIGIGAYVFLTLPYSRFVWNEVPLISSNTFVWRLVFPLTVLAIIFVCITARAFSAYPLAQRVLTAVAILSVAQGVVFINWQSHEYLSIHRITEEQVEENLAKESDRRSGWGIDEYRPNPRNVEHFPETCHEFKEISASDPLEVFFEVEEGQAGQCYRWRRYWNVRYVATINSNPVPIYRNNEGEIVLAPGGRYGKATIRLEYPGYLVLARSISVAGVVVLVCWLVYLAYQSNAHSGIRRAT